MNDALDEDALRRIAAFAEAQAERAARLRQNAERLRARGREDEAGRVQALETEATSIADDLSKLVAFAEAAKAAQARTDPRAADAQGLETAQAAHREATARLETIAEAAGNAVAHLQQLAPAANSVLIHENALKAFRWLERTAKANGAPEA